MPRRTAKSATRGVAAQTLGLKRHLRLLVEMVVAVVAGTAGRGDRVNAVGELSVFLDIVREIALHHRHGEIMQEIAARVPQIEALLLLDLTLELVI